MHVHEAQLCCDDAAFFELSRFLLEKGIALRFRASGGSMHPSIRDGDIVLAVPVGDRPIARGDVLLYPTPGGSIVVHRVIRRDRHGRVLPKGDAAPWSNEGWIEPSSVWGRVIRVERGGHQVDTTTFASRWLGLGASLLRTIPQRISVILERLHSLPSVRSRDREADCCPE